MKLETVKMPHFEEFNTFLKLGLHLPLGAVNGNFFDPSCVILTHLFAARGEGGSLSSKETVQKSGIWHYILLSLRTGGVFSNPERPKKAKETN